MTNRTIRAASAAVLAMGVFASADPVAWDGNGTPDADGNWSQELNWDTDLLPTELDQLTLGSVTSGTRTITQDIAAGTSINTLAFVQSNSSGINRLSLAGNLSVTKVGSAGMLTTTLSGGATAANVVLDLNGYDLILTNSVGTNNSNFNVTLGGTINFAAGSGLYNADALGHHITYTATGVLNVTADARLGRSNGDSTNNTGNFSLTINAGAVLDVSGGILTMDSTGRRGQARSHSLNNSGAVTIAPGAGIVQEWVAEGNSTAAGNVLVNNNASGTIMHGGLIGQRAHKDSLAAAPVVTITNNGLWTINGGGAVIKRLTTTDETSYIAVPTFTVAGTGELRGNSISDALEYDEEVATGGRMAMINQGVIAPGAGTNQTGLTSAGTLALRDIDVTFGETGRLNIDVGGAAGGQYDMLALQTGSTDPAGAGTLDLSASGDTLAVTLVNGFAPESSFSIPILTYGAVTLNGGVGFDVLTVNGLTDNAATYNDGVGIYSISYGGGSAHLMYTVPEPGTAGLIATVGLALLRRRRRA